jgi:Tol biopolymer transport system component
VSDTTVFSPVRDPSNTFSRIDVLDTSTGKRSPWAGDLDMLDGPTPPYVDRFSATPSPDRTKVAYLVQHHGQPPRPYLADPRGRHAHLLMSAVDAPCDRTKRPAWNADGTKMAVVCVLPDDQWSLWIVSATDGARVKQVVASTPENLGSPSWDTTHHRIYMWTGPRPDHGLGTSGTPVWVPDDSAQPVTPKPVVGTRGDTYTDPDWASPGLLLVHELPDGNRIVVVDDGRPHIVAQGPYQYAAWSPDHRRIVAVKGQNGPNARMVVFDYPDGTARTVGGPAWLGTPIWGTR